MKRCFVVFSMVLAAVWLAAVPVYAVNVGAASAVLMDADSGRVLYSFHQDEPRLIASTTKLLTALVAVEHCDDLDAEITVKPEWTGIEGSSVYLVPGEIVTLRGLLYGLLLQSGNDAAVAVACHVAGDVEAFADLMNLKAAELGMNNSHFTNPSGLNDDEHYSTAYDMALLACACLKNDTVAEICAAKSAVVGNRTFYNHNKLLSRYEGCVGMKTGYTELAGRTLVSAAVRNGQTLVCVTLNDRNDWNDHEKLLDYGFSAYPSQKLCTKGDVFGWVGVKGSLVPAVSAEAVETVCFPIAEGECLEMRIELDDHVQAPFTAGMTVGKVQWLLNGTVAAETELVCSSGANADADVNESFVERIFRWFGCCVLTSDGAHLI